MDLLSGLLALTLATTPAVETRLWMATGVNEMTKITWNTARVWFGGGRYPDGPVSGVWEQTFWGVDLGKPVYVGLLNVNHWQGQFHTPHVALRVGYHNEARLLDRLSFVYDVAVVPLDWFSSTTYGGGIGWGFTYDVGLRYQLSEHVSIVVGQEQWWFRLPAGLTADGYHVWPGNYVGMSVRW